MGKNTDMPVMEQILVPILIWWLISLIIGLVGWPLAFSLLGRLPDRGFTMARPVGLLVSGYILWLGGSFRLVQNNLGGIITVLILTLALGLGWRYRQANTPDAPSPMGWLRREWRFALSVELLFAAALVGWAIFKAYNPNIETAGGEKWMEIAFINGTLRSSYFPPQDPWLAGYGISYYYFGYVLMAMITRLSGLASHVAFNLYVPTLLALTLTAALGLVANLVGLTQIQENQPQASPRLAGPAISTGLLAALFVAVQGHLEGLLEVLHKRGLLPPAFWTWLDIRDLKIPPADAGTSWLPDRFIWWWRGSRVLTDYTLTGHEQEVIDEFPFFSFLLADVHPHVLALPFVLLAVALALNLLAAPPPEDRPGLPLWRAIWRDLTAAMGGRLAFGLYAVAVGGLSFLNTWDFPIYLGVIGLSFLAWLALQPTADNRSDNNLLLRAAGGAGLLAATGVLLYLPFYATFQSQARGLLPNLWNPTRLPQFVVFFGPFLLTVLGLLLVLSAQETGWRRHLRWSLPLAILGPLLVMLIVLSGLLLSPAGRDYMQSILNHPEVQAMLGDTTVSALVLESLRRRAVNPWTFLFLGGLTGWTLALGLPRLTGSKRDIPVTFSLILLLMGLALPLAVEFVYLRDNFGIRMNTIFKFYFQAWVLLALVSAYGVYYVSRAGRGWAKLAWQVGLAGLVAAGLIYPVLATADKTNYFQNRPTLNGIQWIADYRPGDYAAIAWLRANAPNNAVILETPGAQYAAYQYTGRMSALTGLPTLLGWGGHQSQWRGNYDEPARREPDIETLFNTTNLAQARQLLEKYNITYVVVGALEREKYAPPGLEKFARLMDVAFQQDDVIIYQKR